MDDGNGTVGFLREKVSLVNEILERTYGVQKRRRESFSRVIIRTILSQNTNDNLRDRAYSQLMKRFKNLREIYHAPLREIVDTIRVCGLPEQKARGIKNYLRWAMENYRTLEPKSLCREEKSLLLKKLLSIKGIGDKTARVAMAMACGMDVFPVDTHIFRIIKRLGIVNRNASIGKAHKIMEELCPSKKSYSLHLNMIKFGREICRARNPLCEKCVISHLCISHGAW